MNRPPVVRPRCHKDQVEVYSVPRIACSCEMKEDLTQRSRSCVLWIQWALPPSSPNCSVGQTRMSEWRFVLLVSTERNIIQISTKSEQRWGGDIRRTSEKTSASTSHSERDERRLKPHGDGPPPGSGRDRTELRPGPQRTTWSPFREERGAFRQGWARRSERVDEEKSLEDRRNPTQPTRLPKPDHPFRYLQRTKKRVKGSVSRCRATRKRRGGLTLIPLAKLNHPPPRLPTDKLPRRVLNVKNCVKVRDQPSDVLDEV